jgi:hypothetical protein
MAARANRKKGISDRGKSWTTYLAAGAVVDPIRTISATWRYA